MLRLGPRGFVVVAIAAQLGVLAWMAGEREWIQRTGRVVLLRTAPIDPRDLFRGDFVRLDYEINHVTPPPSGPPATGARRARDRHEVVYTRLLPAGEGLYEAGGTTTQRPTEGLFIRGRTEEGWRFGAAGPIVKYGIEQFFVEQGQGKAIEDRRGTRNGLQVPMEVEVALGGSGTAVIRGYRWSRLGLRLEVVRRPAQRRPNAPPPEGPLSPKLRITLANASDAPVAIADFADHCAFRLVPVQSDPGAARVAEPTQCTSAKPGASDVITLAPGQSQAAEIDLSEPRWFVLDKDGKSVEAGTLPGFARYRIEYRAPPPGELAEATTLWRGRIASQAFNATGAID
jgi:uncharacterized membrane-anchored protein